MRKLLLPFLVFCSLLVQAQNVPFRAVHNAQAIDYLAAVKYFEVPYGDSLARNVNRTGINLFYLTADSIGLYYHDGSNWIKLATGADGFNNPMTTLGDMMYQNATPAPDRLAGNTTTTKKFLVQTGNGTISAAPLWGTILAGDVPDLSATYLVRSNNLSDVASASTSRINLGATTVGASIFTVTNPSAIRYIRINADNTVTLRTAAEMLSDIGGTSYTDEQAQDAIGAMVSSEFTYTDGTPLLAINTIAATKITGTKTSVFISDFDAAARAAHSLTTTGTSGAATYNSTTGAWNIPQYQAAGSYQATLSGTGLVKSTAGTISYITDNSTNWNTAYDDRLKWDGGATGLTASTGRASLGGTTVGQNIFIATNPSAIRWIRVNADNTVTFRSAAETLSDIGAQASGTYVISVGGTSPIVSSGGTTPVISINNAAADGSTKGAAAFTAVDFDAASGVISIDYTNGQASSGSTKGFLTAADWTTFNNKQPAGSYLTSETDPLALKIANNLSDLNNAATARTNLGGSTVGKNIYISTNPSAITFLKANADNTVVWESASTFRTSIGAGTGNGSVTTLSVVTANGFAGTVANATTTPAITLTTSITGILKGNGTAISAAVAGTDYENVLTFSTGLTRVTNTITANISTGIAGSQTIYGGTAANEDLTIEGTVHATKTSSYVNLQPGAGNVGIGNTAPLAKLHVTGGVLAEGTTGNNPLNGAGTRMVWIPSKATFVAGLATGTSYDTDSIGSYSIVAGYDNISGGYFGGGFQAVFGRNNKAYNNYEVVAGQNSVARGLHAVSIGNGNFANNNASVALGSNDTTSGNAGFTVGQGNLVRGHTGMALGYYLKSILDHQVVVGSYNDTLSSAGVIFGVGVGSSEALRTNAFTVRNTGEAVFGKSGVLAGSLKLDAATSGYVIIKTPATVTPYDFITPSTASPVNGYVLTGNTDGTTGWAAGGGGGSPALSSITAATATNVINHAAYQQWWQWNTLAGGNGFTISSASTAATSNSQNLFFVELYGTNATAGQTTIAARINNTHGGTTSTNIALQLTASGGTTANYAMIVPSGGGNVGIGTSTPVYPLDIVGVFRTTVTEQSSTSFVLTNSHASFDNSLFYSYTTRAGSTAFKLLDLRVNGGSNYAMNIDGNGNMILGNGNTAPASAVSSFSLIVGTAPSGSVTNGATFYATGANAEMTVRDELGNVTTISPHNFSRIPGGASEELAWSYNSSNGNQFIAADMALSLRTIEELHKEIEELKWIIYQMKGESYEKKSPITLIHKGKIKE